MSQQRPWRGKRRADKGREPAGPSPARQAPRPLCEKTNNQLYNT